MASATFLSNLRFGAFSRPIRVGGKCSSNSHNLQKNLHIPSREKNGSTVEMPWTSGITSFHSIPWRSSENGRHLESPGRHWWSAVMGDDWLGAVWLISVRECSVREDTETGNECLFNKTWQGSEWTWIGGRVTDGLTLDWRIHRDDVKSVNCCDVLPFTVSPCPNHSPRRILWAPGGLYRPIRSVTIPSPRLAND